MNVHIYCIGPDGTEYYAARSESEMKEWYRATVGDETADEDLRDHFEEVTGIDIEFDFNDDGQVRRTTWRKLAEEIASDNLPCQLSTGYL